ncbi:hypothetical protein F5887DRAFT_952697 [Amanita rubescens]|nr:hypothetical protein F5887DRAFT_952697 [Amanita rubescens]
MFQDIEISGLYSTTSTRTLILYNALPVSNVAYIALYFITSKLHAISFLATQIIRGRVGNLK